MAVAMPKGAGARDPDPCLAGASASVESWLARSGGELEGWWSFPTFPSMSPRVGMCRIGACVPVVHSCADISAWVAVRLRSSSWAGSSRSLSCSQLGGCPISALRRAASCSLVTEPRFCAGQVRVCVTDACVCTRTPVLAPVSGQPEHSPKKFQLTGCGDLCSEMSCDTHSGSVDETNWSGATLPWLAGWGRCTPWAHLFWGGEQCW